MTQPIAGNGGTGGLPGGGRGGTFSVGAPVKPKMTDEEMRLECLKQAVQSGAVPTAIIGMANDMFGFVKNGSA